MKVFYAERITFGRFLKQVACSKGTFMELLERHHSKAQSNILGALAIFSPLNVFFNSESLCVIQCALYWKSFQAKKVSNYNSSLNNTHIHQAVWFVWNSFNFNEFKIKRVIPPYSMQFAQQYSLISSYFRASFIPLSPENLYLSSKSVNFTSQCNFQTIFKSTYFPPP